MKWLVAFAWTLALELPVYTLVLGHRMRSWQRLCAAVFAVNAVTHPLLWFAFPRFEPFWLYALAGETCVVVAEAAMLALAIPLRAAIVASVLANATSLLLGLLVMRLFAG
jgi:hypothetical protein